MSKEKKVEEVDDLELLEGRIYPFSVSKLFNLLVTFLKSSGASFSVSLVHANHGSTLRVCVVKETAYSYEYKVNDIGLSISESYIAADVQRRFDFDVHQDNLKSAKLKSLKGE